MRLADVDQVLDHGMREVHVWRKTRNRKETEAISQEAEFVASVSLPQNIERFDAISHY